MFTLLPITLLAEQYLSSIVLADVLNQLASGNYDASNLWGSFGSSVCIFIGLIVVGTIGWRIIDICQWMLEGRVLKDITDRIYAHLLAQSASFHANRFSGALVSQTHKFTSGYVRVADTTLYQVWSLISSLVFTIIILVPRAPLFVVVLVILSVVYVVSGFFVTKKVRRLMSEHANLESSETGYLADSVTNIMAIKSFSGSAFEKRSFGKYTGRTRSKLLEVMRANNKQLLFFSSMNRIVTIAALIIAILGVTKFEGNIATVFLIFTFTNKLLDQLWVFCNRAIRDYNRAFGDAEEMTKILAITPEVKDPVQPERSKISAGAVAFNNVTFTHDGADDSIFSQLSLSIKPGEKIGLVGHSGSGKTTFVRVLLRFSDIDAGEILIDGQNIAHITQDDLHKQLAYVPQEPIMFHRSLEENIRYGDFKASREQVLKAAKSAHAHEFIDQLPDGYDTLVGERGIKLSGGQRQRIAIARAILKDAPILVLDEATSALDSESEVLIQDALWRLMEGRTAIVIAHRLSTIQKMDRIIVLDNGEIAEEGSHQELLTKNGTYAKLWAHQSGGFLDE